MAVKQLSVFIQNEPGKMTRAASALSGANVDIRAMSIADTTDFGILRLIVDEPERARDALRAAGCTVSLSEVLAVEVDDRPGGLAKVIAALSDSGVNIEYIYAFVARSSDKAYVILKPGDIAAAEESLSRAGIRLIDGSEIYGI